MLLSTLWVTSFGFAVAGILALLLSILGMFQFFLYIKYSWINRNNSLNLTGADYAQDVVLPQNLKSDIKVKKSIFRWRFVHFNSRTRTMKTGMFVSRRRSLWSIADGAAQSYAADVMDKESRGEKTNVKAWVYKIQAPLPMILISIMNTFAISLMIYGVISYSETGSLFALVFMLMGIIGFMILSLVYTYAVWKGYQSISQNSDIILGNQLTNKETKDIKFLWKVTALIALITLILEIIVRILQVIELASKNKNN